MTLDGEAGGKGLVMQVNKYVPHYQRIPQKFIKDDFKIFKYAPNEGEDTDQYEKVRGHIESFDRILIDSLMVDREKKYAAKFSDNDGHDSDEERENAHGMFVEDLQNLRQYFIDVIKDRVQ